MLHRHLYEAYETEDAIGQAITSRSPENLITESCRNLYDPDSNFTVFVQYMTNCWSLGSGILGCWNLLYRGGDGGVQQDMPQLL